MKKLSPDQVQFFNENGYLIVPKVLPEQILAQAREAYGRILAKCLNGTYSEYRVENQMSDYHIFGIERIFNPEIYEEAILDASISSGVLDYTQQLLATEEPYIILNRIHLTNNFSYSGPWHRDGAVGQTHHVQSGIFLFPEERFFVVPGSHLRPDAEEHRIEGELWSRKALATQVCLEAQAGDLLLFHSSILHRGSCVGRGAHRRAYIHYRIGKMDRIHEMTPPEYDKNPRIFGKHAGWDKALKNSLDPKIPHRQLVQRSVLQRNLRGVLKKTFYRMAYYLLSFLPEDHDLFTKKPNFTPFLRPYKRK